MSKTFAALAGVLMLAALPVQAQTASQPAPAATTLPPATTEALTDADIARMRAELRADKKKVTAETLQLTDAEAAKFWPLFERYQVEMNAIGDRVRALVEDYVAMRLTLRAHPMALLRPWLEAA